MTDTSQEFFDDAPRVEVIGRLPLLVAHWRELRRCPQRYRLIGQRFVRPVNFPLSPDPLVRTR